jgi:hypothetical protein
MTQIKIGNVLIFLPWLVAPVLILFIACLITGVAPSRSTLIVRRSRQPAGYWTTMVIIGFIVFLSLAFVNIHLWHH